MYPGEAAGTGAAGTMVFRLTIDDTGSVAEARYIGHDRYALREVKGRLEAAPMLDSVFLAATENALKGWLYEPPADAPIAIDVEFAFAGNGRVRQVWLEPARILSGARRSRSPESPPWSASAASVPTTRMRKLRRQQSRRRAGSKT